MAEKRLLQELNQLSRTAPSKTNPQIIELAPIDSSESLLEWHAIIAKESRDDSPYYYNGQWNLLISVGKEYPMKPPTIRFDAGTPINHPNINLKTGEICLDILKSEAWSPAWNLLHLVGAILLLLDDPEPDSPLNIDLANLFRHDKVAFESMVQFTMWKYGTFCDSRARDRSGIKVIKGVSLEDSYVFVNPFAHTDSEENTVNVEETSILVEEAAEEELTLNERGETILKEEVSLEVEEAVQQHQEDEIASNLTQDVDTTVDTSTDVSSALSLTVDEVPASQTTKDSKIKRSTSIKKSLSSALRRDKRKKKSKNKT